ncbi:MAG: polyprenyl synthetase family protein, partial [Hyphomicrobiales bacterium]|nr:polyprenyl synthetase family protein [Hyphomicrobiales bacterium]
LPAMDDDDLRRGKPTVHKAFDEATAILAGDSLLTLAFAVMADPRVHNEADVRAGLVAAFAAAAGPGGMAGGQMLDLVAEAADVPLDQNAIRTLQAMKTGALIRFACEAGALIGGASPDDRRLLSDFGARLGLLFQITDDLLDATSDAATLGKAAGKDASRNKGTLVSLLGIEGAKQLRDCEEAAAGQLLAPFAGRARTLLSALQFACARQF